MKSTTCILLLSAIAPTAAFVAPSQSRTATALSAQTSRTDFLRDIAAVGVASVASGIVSLPAFADDVTPSGVSIKVVKSGKGPAPDIGELAAIRFASFQGETKIDDIFDTPEPYYTRIGSGGLIKGVEEVLPKMRLGDRWVLTIPVSYEGVDILFLCLVEGVHILFLCVFNSASISNAFSLNVWLNGYTLG